MKIVRVRLARQKYLIHIGMSLDKIGDAIKPYKPSKILVVTNTQIYGLHGQQLIKGLKKAPVTPVFTMVPEGEQFKTIEQANHLYRSCLRAGLDRNSMIIGFGGGVIGDISGFTAATYMRGVGLAHVPTTLLAMVDSSIGGKTGVDLPEGKNLIGSFYQPQMVWVDLNVLKTLPEAEWKNGMAEIIKYGVIADRRMFQFLETLLADNHRSRPLQRFIFKQKYPFNLSRNDLEHIVVRSCEIKAQVVQKDEREEKGVREVLNFGHTFGHALE
ncbi:MAG: iron-containing alcohol dehydrogenase, partial [Elusimicrobia bacterium]|nr:iron-containing alcohol dehydrogenase [Elusimicrobiota bacterium]MBD3412757.1 iron-containing alcohol dehydrogenase [Elusimicrobiota bacterium]